MTSTGQRMPTLYIPHGAGPCFFMDWNPPGMWQRMGDWLRGAMADLPARPTTILMVSAHWEEPQFTVGDAAQPGMLFDYSGFPPHTYQFRYGSPGSPEVAKRVRSLLDDAGLQHGANGERGYDHGMFIPLMLMAPEADIPVVQLSLRSGLDPHEHVAAGRALQPLRDEGVFIVGSGMSFHNMRGYGNPRYGPVSDRFDDWLAETVTIADPDARAQALSAWAAHPDGRPSHPREEHLIPLMVVSGSGGNSSGRRVFSDRVMETTVSAFRFG
ncbi:MAG: class III extradiol ring-cleavage dioxygenase [Burkholderiaceae bacterium]